MNQFAGQLADAIIAAAEQHKPEILAALQAAEGGAEAAIVSAIKNAPKPGGLMGVALPLIENELAAEVQKLVAENGPEVAFAFLDSEARAFAKSLGG